MCRSPATDASPSPLATPPRTLSMKKENPYRSTSTTVVLAQMQVAAPRYISHHRPPAISRKIGSVSRAGGGGGAERRSRNSVRAQSCALGNGAPVAVWPRARTRVASPAASTPPHEYPGDGASSSVHESTVCVFRSREGPGPRRARCPRAGRRALVVVRGAAAAGRALRASPRAVRAARRPRRGRCADGGRLRERALQHHRAAVAAAARGRPARAHRVVVGGRMRRCCCFVVRGRRPGAPALATSARCRRSRRRQPHALGSSAGVRGHGAAGRAGGTAPQARPQAPPFHIGMGEAAETASYGGPSARDGGARDARAFRCGRRTPRPAAQHTAAGRRVRPGRASTVTSPLSASRADEKQFPASTEQMRERRARMGGRGERAARRGRRRGGHGAGRQKGRAAAESHALVGANGPPARAAVPAERRGAAVCHGAAPRRAHAAARRVTPPRRATSLPYHAYIPLSGRSRSPGCPRVPEYYRLDIYLFGTGAGPCLVTCAELRERVRERVRVRTRGRVPVRTPSVVRLTRN